MSPTVERYRPQPGDRCGACDKNVPVIARKLAHGWVIHLCVWCLDRELKALSLGSPVNAGSETEVRGSDLKKLPILGIIPEIL
jgi:hypothetical protein